MKTSLCTILALLFLVCDTCASLVAYWDMDAPTLEGKLAANAGTQVAEVSSQFQELAVGFTAEILPDVVGTGLNLVGPPSATNRSVGFYRAATIYATGAFLMQGFDFSSLSGVVLSFAYLSESVFTWDVHLQVDYRLGAAPWETVTSGQVWSSGWSLASVSFGSLLDGASDVSLRIRTSSWVSGFGYLDLDNVQVNAIPEPENFSLLVLTAISFFFWRRQQSFSLRN